MIMSDLEIETINGTWNGEAKPDGLAPLCTKFECAQDDKSHDEAPVAGERPDLQHFSCSEKEAIKALEHLLKVRQTTDTSGKDSMSDDSSCKDTPPLPIHLHDLDTHSGLLHSVADKINKKHKNTFREVAAKYLANELINEVDWPIFAERLALCFINLTAQNTYRGLVTSIYLVCKEFGLVTHKRSFILGLIKCVNEFLDSSIVTQFKGIYTEEEIKSEVVKEAPKVTKTRGVLDDDVAFADDRSMSGDSVFVALETHSGSSVKIGIDMLISCIKNPGKLANLGLIKPIVRFIRAIMGMGLMQYWAGSYNMQGVKLFALQPIEGGVFEILSVIADSLQSFADYGYAMIMEGTLFPKNFTFDKLQNLEFRVADLDAWMPFYENGRLVERGLQRADYLKRIDDAKREILLLKKTNTDKMVDRTLVHLYAKLEKLLTRTAMVTLSSQLKYCPFGYLIAGPAGIGKSSITSHMTKAFLAWKKTEQGWKPEGDERDYVVTVNTADKFQSEVFSHHIVGLLDDFMNKCPERVAPGENAHDFLIKIINNVPCVALKPDIESKGAVPINFELVGLTTNVDHLYASIFVNDTYSILRRVGFVVYPFVREKFRKEDSTALDPTKALGHTDLWRFDVKYPMPGNASRFYKLDNGKDAHNIDLVTLLELYKREWTKHDASQQAILSAQKVEVPLCNCGFPSDVCRVCSDYESPDEEFPGRNDKCRNDGQVDVGDPQTVAKRRRDEKAGLVKPRPFNYKHNWSKSTNVVEGLQTHVGRDDVSALPIDEIYISDGSPTADTTASKDIFDDEVINSIISQAVSGDIGTLERIIPTQIRGDRQYENIPWMIDFIPECIIRRLPTYVTLTAFTYHTLIHRKFISKMCVGLFALAVTSGGSLHWLLRLAALVSAGGIYIYLINQHAWLVSRYIVARRQRWSRFVALRNLPSTTRNGLKSFALLCFQGSVIFVILKMLKTMFDKIDYTPEGGTYSIPTKTVDFTKIEVTRAPGITPINATLPQLKIFCEKLCGVVSYKGCENKRLYLNTVFLGNGLIMTPSHFLPDDEPLEVEILMGSGTTIGHKVKCYLCRKDGYKIPNKDLMIFYASVTGDKPDIRKFLPEKDVEIDQVCHYLYREKDGRLVVGDKNIRLQRRELASSDKRTGVRYESTGYGYVSDHDFGPGSCCTIFITNTKVPYIHSFHVAGKDHYGATNQLTAYELDGARLHFSEKKSTLLLAHSGEMDLNRIKNFKMVDKPTKNSPLLQLDEDSAFEYYGTIDTPVTRFTHSVHKTIICDRVCEQFGVNLNHKAPPQGGTWKHHLACLKNTTSPNQGFPQELVESATSDYYDSIIGSIKVLAANAVPMSLDETVNGVPEFRGLEKMNRKTSAGFPYFKAKNKICPIVDDKMVLTEEMVTQYNAAVETWKTGQRTYEVFHQSLKDEPVKLSKEVARTFQCSNMNLSLGLRQYFLPILIPMIQMPEVFEMAVGCNAEGPEWDALIKSISKFGEDRIVAGDYKNYDQKMSSQVLSAAFRIYIDIAREIGYKDEDITIMTVLATEVLFPVIHMNGDVFKIFGSMTSGNSLTTIGNCTCNSLLHRIVFFGLARRMQIKVPMFKSVCSLMTYGDDCADSVRPGFDWFNHTNRQDFFAEYGITYTMAVKDKSSVPFINICELSFLKRTPRYDEELDMILGPLDETSIFKSLQFITKSQLSPEESAAVNMDNALAAWFYHGREVYEKRSLVAFRILEEFDLIPYSRCYGLTYNDFLCTWIQRYKTGISPIEIHPNQLGCKVEEWAGDTDYDVKYMRGLRNLVDACSRQATLPVGVPLFRGDDAGRQILYDTQAGACLGDCECKIKLHPKNNNKNNIKSPPPSRDGGAVDIVGGVNLKKPQARIARQQSQRSLLQPISDEDIQEILSYAARPNTPVPDTAAMARARHRKFSEMEDRPSVLADEAIRADSAKCLKLKKAEPCASCGCDDVDTEIVEVLKIDGKILAIYKDLEPHAGTIMMNPKTAPVTHSGTMVFSDTDANVINSVEGSIDVTRMRAMNAGDAMSAFLSRPVLIQTRTVAVGASTYAEFNPWKLFIENKRVINRINNYNNLRGKLHVKFLINGNGFYYGKLIASYLPLRPDDALEHSHVTASPANITLATQRPHVFLDPCMSTSGQLDLPFFFWKDAMNIPAADWNRMGSIFIESINVLRNANASTADLTITVFAWMSEVTLDSPTLTPAPGLVAQVGEYSEKDIISRPASVLANAANMISPYLGSLSPFAMAVSNSAGVASNIAKSLGYSRPLTVEQPMKMAPRHIGNLANYDVVDNSTKLALDSKNEVTVDTRVMGLAGKDETSFTYLAGISNYLRSVQWNSTQLTGVKLTSLRVWPFHRIGHGTLIASAYPSYALPTFDFAYWTGTFVLKIEVVCSTFHKGRLQIVYDPNNVDAAPESNIQHTYIMDISDTKELVIEIPWSQSRTFLNSLQAWPTQTSDPGFDVTGTSPVANGQIGIYVLNELTVPSATTQPIEINLYGSFKDDFKVMAPERVYEDAIFRNLTTQMGEMTDCAEDCQMPNDTDAEYTAGGDKPSDQMLKVFAGESITNFRALWKRPVLLYVFPLNSALNAISTFVFPVRPKPRGTIPTFINYNLAANSGMTLISYAYAGWRGSIRYKTVTNAQSSQVSLYASTMVVRGFDAISSVINYTFGTTTTINDLARSMSAVYNSTGRQNKCQEVQNTQHQPNVEAEFPYYSLNRFFPTRFIGFELNPTERVVRMDTSQFAGTRLGWTELYTCTGEDFQVGFFTGLPLLVNFGNPAPPVAA